MFTELRSMSCPYAKVVLKTPSYLESLLGRDKDISLIYSNKPPKSYSLDDTTEIVSPPHQTTSETIDLDLTGAPLEVDLKCNNSTISADLQAILEPWPKSEMTHFSLDLKVGITKE